MSTIPYFRSGTKVKRIEDSFREVTQGKIYTVKHCDGFHLNLVGLKEDYCPTKFKKVNNIYLSKKKN